MASPRMHPRRSSPLSPRSMNTTPVLDIAAASLKKGATFHSPTTPSGENDPVLNIATLPQRSSTSLKELEDIVAAKPSERIQRIIGAVDRSLSDLRDFAADPDKQTHEGDLPLPQFLVAGSTKPELKCNTTGLPSPPREGRKHHASDSGIGSSVSSEEDTMDKKGMEIVDPPAAPIDSLIQGAARSEGRVKTGINGISAMSSSNQHVLGEYACRQIQKHIIIPIVREERLKKFHPLVSGLPYRISRKEITCLRDLEKVLLWLAPKYSVSKASFLLFCETTIQCLHTTVDHLNERDQRRPSDRPYTNAYFVDLVEQVRQYAAHLAASNSRMPSDERLELIGGLGRTGHQAELVRTKDGRSVSLRTGQEISSEYRDNLKRSSAQIEEELELERSMARRKKNAPIEKTVQRCSECSKSFKRPCDLTKHEKTHSRPWKCSESGCKYYEYGWPTEKERDRHVNDKHSAAPTLFRCRFHPCPYESKRESNCKQHMEKAHGWTYVKSKSNGKIRKSPNGMNGASPPTPVESTPGSHIFTASSPDLFGDDFCSPVSHHRTVSIDSSGLVESSADVSPDMANFNATFGPASTFAWPDASANYGGGADLIDFGTAPTNTRQSWDSAMTNPDVVPSAAFENISEGDVSMFGTDFNWSAMDGQDVTQMNVQLATPALSVDQLPTEFFNKTAPGHMSSLSPTAQGQQMLYSPYSVNSSEAVVDEGYCGDFNQTMVAKPMGDFSLFGSDHGTNMGDLSKTAMFADLTNFGNMDMSEYLPMDE